MSDEQAFQKWYSENYDEDKPRVQAHQVWMAALEHERSSDDTVYFNTEIAKKMISYKEQLQHERERSKVLIRGLEDISGHCLFYARDRANKALADYRSGEDKEK